MLEVHDELMTPGCPQCAIKHLCAALSYAADHNGGDEQMGLEFVLAARALINLAEADIGYRSHRDFAIGLLERAERTALTCVGDCRYFVGTARDLRVAVIAGSPDETHARSCLHALIHPSSYMWAHLVEAARELPGRYFPTGDPSVEAIQATLKSIREEYFPEAPVASSEDAEKGGETDMATKKAVKPAAKAAAKKADPKAAKAACKGGKCKGKKC